MSQRSNRTPTVKGQMGRIASRKKGRLRFDVCLCLRSFIGLDSRQLSQSTTAPLPSSTQSCSENSLHLFFDRHSPSMGFREGEKDEARLWVAILSEMLPHCSTLAPSLHHLPTSFISSARHWEHSTTHLPPVNIARRLNYTHPHSQTQAQSQQNSLQRRS